MSSDSCPTVIPVDDGRPGGWTGETPPWFQKATFGVVSPGRQAPSTTAAHADLHSRVESAFSRVTTTPPAEGARMPEEGLDEMEQDWVMIENDSLRKVWNQWFQEAAPTHAKRLSELAENAAERLANEWVEGAIQIESPPPETVFAYLDGFDFEVEF